MNPIRIAVAAGIIALGAAASFAANAETRASYVGVAAPLSAATRTVVIDGNTRWVNVTHGETVKFVVNGNAFAVNFNGDFGDNANLQRLAPDGLLDHRVNAVVEAGPFDMANYRLLQTPGARKRAPGCPSRWVSVTHAENLKYIVDGTLLPSTSMAIQRSHRPNTRAHAFAACLRCCSSSPPWRATEPETAQYPTAKACR
jgi:hypothetical protein